MKRTVDVAALPQSFALDVGVLDSFAACEVDDVQFGLLGARHFLLDDLALHLNAENGVRAGALVVHGGGGHLPHLLSLEQQSHCCLVRAHPFFSKSLHENSLLCVLSDLVDALVGRELNGSRLTRSKICSL